ncbi:hypothetical protein CPC08DRAFT_706073 [Agrocybe pediades]|nr:hypothetical protein CPC08DRAFT_706073 [Agrocybe pediades]
MCKPTIQDMIVDSTIQTLDGLNLGKDEGAPRQRRPHRQRRRNTNSRKAGNLLDEKPTTTIKSASASATIIGISPHGGPGGAGGAVNILGGEFNAVAGSQYRVNNLTINNASEEVLPSKGRNFRSMVFFFCFSFLVSLDIWWSKGQRGKDAKLNQGLATFQRSPDPYIQRGCDVYSRHLALLGRGFPLWLPAPNRNLPVEYQKTGTRIGDVGIITSSGGFDFLFNVCLPWDHPINPGHGNGGLAMPDGFEPLVLHPNDVREYSPCGRGSSLASASVRKTFREGEYLFESASPEGAILTIPDGSTAAELGNLKKLQDYASQHAESWYRYVNVECGRQARNGDVRMIIGFDKTASWGIATFSNPATGGQREHSVFRFMPAVIERGDSPNGVEEYWWDYLGVHMAEARTGPDSRDVEKLRSLAADFSGNCSGKEQFENQCLFIRTLNLRMQDGVWGELKAEFGDVSEDEDSDDRFTFGLGSGSSRPASSGSDSSTAVSSGQSSAGSKFNFGSTRYNLSSERFEAEGALSNAQAKMAITTDQDWMSVITEDDYTMPSDMEMARRINSSFSFIQEGSVAYLAQGKVPSTPQSEEPVYADDIFVDEEDMFAFSPPEDDCNNLPMQPTHADETLEVPAPVTFMQQTHQPRTTETSLDETAYKILYWRSMWNPSHQLVKAIY